MKQKYAVMCVVFVAMGLVALFAILTPDNVYAQTCAVVPGQLDIKIDYRNTDGQHFTGEFHPGTSLQKEFKVTTTEGAVLTTGVEYLGCFTTEDVCYGAFALPTNSLEFATGVASVTVQTDRLRAESCSVKVVPTKVIVPGFMPLVGSVTFLQESPGQAGPLVQINGNSDGSFNAFSLASNGESANITDLVQKNGKIITTSVGSFYEVNLSLQSPFWTYALTTTAGVLVQVDWLIYRVGGVEQLQFQKGDVIDLKRDYSGTYYRLSESVRWPLVVLDPSAGPEFVVTKVESMTVTGYVKGISARPEIVQTAIFWQDGTAEDVQEKVYTHTFRVAGSYVPIVYGYTQGHQQVSEEKTKQVITVPVITTPTPTPTPKPASFVIITSTSPVDLYLDFQRVMAPKQQVLVNIGTRQFPVAIVDKHLKLPDGWKSFSFGVPGLGIVIRTGFAFTDGLDVYRTEETLMMSDIRK